MLSTFKLLFLGANGYIGGSVLDTLLKSPRASQFDIISYLRSEEKAQKVAALGLKTISGGLHELQDAVAQADVIFNCASSDDLPLIEAILAGAKKTYAATNVAPILIHTSGSAIVADDTKGNGPSRPPTDDADEIILDHLPIQAPHRHVDIPLAAAHEEGYVRVYVLAPPVVYGLATGRFVDAGIQNPVPTAILLSCRIAALRGQYGQIGPGKNVWSTVEIHDVAKLYLTILAYVIDGKPLDGGKAYYAAVDGEFVAGEAGAKLAQYLHEFGVLKTAAISHITTEELVRFPMAVALAINSRMTDSRSRSLGWQPTHTSQDLMDGLRSYVEEIAKQDISFGGLMISPAVIQATAGS